MHGTSARGGGGERGSVAARASAARACRGRVAAPGPPHSSEATSTSSSSHVANSCLAVGSAGATVASAYASPARPV